MNTARLSGQARSVWTGTATERKIRLAGRFARGTGIRDCNLGSGCREQAIMKRSVELSFALAVSFCFVSGCSSEPPGDGAMDDGPVAEGVSGALGTVMPSATANPGQVEAFDRGRGVMARRFDLSDGLGPSFNIASCGGCHEKPTLGGSAGLYRNFFLGGRLSCPEDPRRRSPLPCPGSRERRR